MRIDEVLTLLRREGIKVDRNQVRHAHWYGWLERPPKNNLGHMEYRLRDVQAMREHFGAKTLKERREIRKKREAKSGAA